MPMMKDAINKMTVEEKFSTMDYIWASLSADDFSDGDTATAVIPLGDDAAKFYKATIE